MRKKQYETWLLTNIKNYYFGPERPKETINLSFTLSTWGES